MRALLLVVLLSACECNTERAPASPGPSVALLPADARRIDAAARAANAVKLAVTGKRNDDGSGVRSLSIVGDHVYWSHRDSDTGTTSYRRVRRTGGSPEELGSTDIFAVVDSPDHALLGDRFVVPGSARMVRPVSRARAPIFVLEAGKRRLFSKGSIGTVVSTSLVVHGDKLYWVAATPLGVGPVQVTDAAGSTKVAVGCPPRDFEACPLLLPGTPPVIVDGPRMILLGTPNRDLAAHCPACTMPTRVVDDHVLCRPSPADTCAGRSYFVRLDGTATFDARGVLDDVTAGGGFYYHVEDAALVRRRSLDGADEHFTPKASLFAVDHQGVAWIEGDTLYAAPH